MEAELGEERPCFIDGCPAEWQALPIPEGRIVAALDGGYVRNWDDRKSNFELIVGRSVPEDRAPRYLGLVHGYDQKPKRRLFEVLKSQGLQANQDVTFLTDGGEEVRSLTELATPEAEHVLDWFHITMRLTVLSQYARGIAHHDAAEGARLLALLESIKWLLWHGNQYRAGEETAFLEDDVDDLEVSYPNLGKFKRGAHIKRHQEPIRALPHVDCYWPTSLPQVVCYRWTRVWDATGWHGGSAWRDGLSFWQR